jgi:hypothetical protein
MMRADDLLLAIVALGVVTTIAYIVSEFSSWQAVKASDRRAAGVLKEVYKKLHAIPGSLHAKTRPIMRAILRERRSTPRQP